MLQRGDTLAYRGPVRLVVRCLDGDPGRLLSVGSAFLGPDGTDAAEG